MRYLDEFNDPALARNLLEDIAQTVTRPWSIMEVCGGQTHTIIGKGIDQLLPDALELVHGPGCPVCVTPIAVIDKALDLAARPEVIFCSFGDMLRVPGTTDNLTEIRSRGGDVRVVYSPLDAVAVAEDNPDRDVVFFAIGFETTAPANAMSVRMARDRGIDNYSILVSQVLVPPAIEAVVGSPTNRVDAFLAAGHVCAVMGTEAYEPLVERWSVPIVVTGFEAVDVLDGIRRAVHQLERGEARVENAYDRVVERQGNRRARDLIDDVFEVCDRRWRGIGPLADSGWRLTEAYRHFDAEVRFDLSGPDRPESSACRSGEVLQGLIKPDVCEAFATSCTPRHPLGATMVSGEGACAAYYRYRRLARPAGE